MDAIEQALQTLGLGPDATPQDIREAYRDLAMVWHPDRFQKDSRLQLKAEENLKEINRAHEILRDYHPASTVRYGPWAGSYPAHDHPGAGAPKQSPPDPTCRGPVPFWAHIIDRMSGGALKLWAHITGRMRGRCIRLLAHITGAVVAICLVGYLVEAPTTSHRPVLPIRSNGSGIGAQEQQSPPASAGLPPRGQNPGEHGSRESAPDRGAGTSPAVGGAQASAPDDVARGSASRSFFTVGSTKDTVLAVQGPPTRSSSRVWTYGSSSVLFSGGRVASWDVEPGSPLGVRMLPRRPVRNTKGFFTVGSTKDTVLAVQGTPSEFSDTVWRYGSSSVLFTNDRVTKWYEEQGSPLKVGR